MTPLLFILVMLVLLWVLLIAPQRRRQQAQRRMLDDVNVGDEILTAGGIYATVREVGDQRILAELAPGMTVTLDRRAVAQILTEDEPAAESADLDEGTDGELAELPEEPSTAQRT